MLKLALSSWSFHRRLPFYGSGNWSPPRENGEMTIDGFLDTTSSLGIDAVEICQMHLVSTDTAYLDGVRGTLDRTGIRLINMPIDVGHVAEADPRKREEQYALIFPWIDAAHALGSPAVRVNTGNVPEGDEETALRSAADGYRRLAEYCGERGMMILLENHGGLSAKPENIMRIVELAGADNFRLCPDFGNFASEVREEGLRKMLQRAAIVHAKVMDFGEDGSHEAFDLDRCLRLVHESGYSGDLSIEFEGKGDQMAGVTRAIAFLRPRLGEEGTA